jgi:hypothetical protein
MLCLAAPLKIFVLAPCDDVVIPWLQHNKTKGPVSDEVHSLRLSALTCTFSLFNLQIPKDRKAFSSRGSILGSFTASISEALSSSLSSQHSPASAASASDPGDSIFETLKRKGSALSEAIFNPSDSGGDCPTFARLFPCRTPPVKELFRSQTIGFAQAAFGCCCSPEGNVGCRQV